MKESLFKEKYEKKIENMKKQLTSNACLWEQLAEAEKREKILKQELLYAQQSIASSDKVIAKLKEDVKRIEHERYKLK